MKVFTRPGELRAVDDETVRAVVTRQLRRLQAGVGAAYDPARDGHVLLVEQGDGEGELLAGFGCPLDALLWEGVWREGGCLCAVTLADNQFGRTVVVPDRPGTADDLRRQLRRELGEVP